MPNWVINKISVEDKYAEKLEEISKVGIARYYKPIPEELVNTTAPQRIPETISAEHSNYLKSKYGFDNWYYWCVKNWGTKWGCRENEFTNNEYWYHTAWAPLCRDLFDRLAIDIPCFNFIWEEEQGFGEKWKCENGIFTKIEEWGFFDLD
tara:strand:- start:1196 stop:1645 length:450 start_codon:yes stop_codon:yes gene_type:complete